ncbi:MAG: B12-binding domain-containing radical SAM protein [Desulfobacteraceae bacterium]|nr:MAG: B12-binding domain-containing radical SAM protein [Desulfobacteraceae bacterium]
MQDHPKHPKKSRAKILLSSVFGPYAHDDEYGSRAINPMELYHNQVTRFQGAFSLRMFHRSFGLMLIQSNIEAPCTLLDFPSLARFTEEIRTQEYDVVGISAILPNIGKVAKMCALVRRYLPRATLVVGGHVTNKEGLEHLVDADHFVRGEGVAWFRNFLGQAPGAPVRHPMAYSAHGARTLGIPLKEKPGGTAAILVPSVGCPVGCNFCSTSALFGGKGRFVNFYETGDDLFAVMEQLARNLKVHSFFVLDENFLLHRKRALRLLELMQTHGKSWSLYVFSSARVLQSYTIEQLIGLGVSWIWMGLEGRDSRYAKLKGVDTRALVQTLQSHGIRVLGSSIIGLEDHRPEEMQRIIEEAVGHAADFHQFMLYTPIAGTPLYEKHRAEGTLLDDSAMDQADIHGQYRFNYRHPHLPAGDEERYLHQAFLRDFEINGPSLARLIRTELTGWIRYRAHPDRRVRERIRREAESLGTTSVAAVWAMRRWYRHDPRMKGRLDRLFKDLIHAFGIRSRLFAPLAGRYIHKMMQREQRRLDAGWTYEPDTFYEKNPAAQALQAAPRQVDKPAPAEIFGKMHAVGAYLRSSPDR